MKLTKEIIDEWFEGVEHQQDWVLKAYKWAFPDWDNIESIDGWPKCEELAWRYIMDKAQKFDQKNHKDVFPGGLWFNKGFSCQQGIMGWEVDKSNCTIKMRSLLTA